MNEWYRGVDGSPARWAITEDDTVYFVDEATGQWSVSQHSAKFVRGMFNAGILIKAIALPFFPVLVPAS